MVKAMILTALVWGHAVVMLAAGVATFWWSQDLMGLLLHLVGEERALGAANVVPLEGAGKLLTNPTAMIGWMLPFWFLGTAQVSAAVMLVWLWSRRIWDADRAEK